MISSKVKRPGPRMVVRRSGIHGRGVYARRPIRGDETVCEYKGEIIGETEAGLRYPENMHGPNRIFVFGIAHDHNIDGGAKGNVARWINHSCAPNCDTYEKDKRMFIRAIRDIRPGEELSYDYCIEAGERITRAVKGAGPAGAGRSNAGTRCWCPPRSRAGRSAGAGPADGTAARAN